MPPPARRTVPDNLDPLVDTLSNVVGILVIVVVLTQLQLGDALTRVAELDVLRTREARVRDSMPAESEALAQRRDALLRRTDGSVEEAIELAEETLSALSKIGAVAPGDGSRSLSELRERLDKSQVELNEERAALEQRDNHIAALQQVPKRLVARLPDPKTMQGKESWILVRNGRIYLADREKLFDQGQNAISRVLGESTRDRFIRPDEFEAVSRYFRKRDVGAGGFRWRLKTEPDVRVELVWRSPDQGLDHTGLAGNLAMRSWLAARSSDIDVILFQVWADSFEAYLAAREVVEAAGFNAGWRGYEIEDELELPIRIGRAAPEVGPIRVD
jgi:hypothetical protein